MAASLAAVALGIAIAGGLLYLRQPSMIFFPYRELAVTPADWGLAYEDVRFEAADGVGLHGWYIPHPDRVGVLLFLHGNAGNISHRGDSVAIFHRLGLDVFIFDYRGYGLSEGRPSEDGLYADARAAWQYLVDRKGVAPADVVIFGRSLGGAVAARLASGVRPGAVIIESSFSSAQDFAHAVFPVLSRLTVIRFRFPAAADLRRVEAPVLVLHSRNDEIMPFALGERLYEAANEPKAFVELEGDHNGGFLLSQPGYERRLAEFLTRELGAHAEDR